MVRSGWRRRELLAVGEKVLSAQVDGIAPEAIGGRVHQRLERPRELRHAEGHAAQCEAGNIQSGRSKFGVLHATLQSTLREERQCSAARLTLQATP